jgi:acyl carrier protein
LGIVPLDWRALEPLTALPFFSRFASEKAPAHDAGFRRKLDAMPAADQLSALLDHVASTVRAVAGIAPSEELDPHQGFFALGLDSLMSVDLRNRLQKSLGCALPVTIAFQQTSAAALADYLAREALGILAKSPEARAAAAPDDELDALLSGIDRLSDQEAGAALAHGAAWRAAGG